MLYSEKNIGKIIMYCAKEIVPNTENGKVKEVHCICVVGSTSTEYSVKLIVMLCNASSSNGSSNSYTALNTKLSIHALPHMNEDS